MVEGRKYSIGRSLTVGPPPKNYFQWPDHNLDKSLVEKAGIYLFYLFSLSFVREFNEALGAEDSGDVLGPGGVDRPTRHWAQASGKTCISSLHYLINFKVTCVDICVCWKVQAKVLVLGGGGSIGQCLAILDSGPSCPGFNSQRSQKKFQRKKLLMLLRLIGGAAYRKANSSLKILIKSSTGKWQATSSTKSWT